MTKGYPFWHSLNATGYHTSAYINTAPVTQDAWSEYSLRNERILKRFWTR